MISTLNFISTRLILQGPWHFYLYGIFCPWGPLSRCFSALHCLAASVQLCFFVTRIPPPPHTHTDIMAPCDFSLPSGDVTVPAGLSPVGSKVLVKVRFQFRNALHIGHRFFTCIRTLKELETHIVQWWLIDWLICLSFPFACSSGTWPTPCSSLAIFKLTHRIVKRNTLRIPFATREWRTSTWGSLHSGTIFLIVNQSFNQSFNQSINQSINQQLDVVNFRRRFF